MKIKLLKKLKQAGFPGIFGENVYPVAGDSVFDSHGNGYLCSQGQFCGARPCRNCPAHREEEGWLREPRVEELEYQIKKLIVPMVGIVGWSVNESRHGYLFGVDLSDTPVLKNKYTSNPQCAAGETLQESLAMGWLRLREYFIDNAAELKKVSPY